jgi:hypothetical protein
MLLGGVWFMFVGAGVRGAVVDGSGHIHLVANLEVVQSGMVLTSARPLQSPKPTISGRATTLQPTLP